MGEAKRRAAASPYAATSAEQMLRGINEALAKLPPMPMRNAVSLDLSPSDHAEVLKRSKVLSADLFGGTVLDGIGLRANPMLIDGLMLGRDRDGKLVWSNKQWMQEAIDGGFAPTV